MPELTDYSGPYKHDLRWEDFSKDFLIELMHSWQWAYLRLTRFWYEAVNERVGSAVADDCEKEAWTAIGERVVPRFARVGKIQVPPNTVLEALKITQLVPDSDTDGDMFAGEVDIKNENHVIGTTTKCRILEFFEQHAPERIPFCHRMEAFIMEKYFNNPKIKVTPLKLPPRKSPDDICCQFEIKLEA